MCKVFWKGIIPRRKLFVKKSNDVQTIVEVWLSMDIKFLPWTTINSSLSNIWKIFTSYTLLKHLFRTDNTVYRDKVYSLIPSITRLNFLYFPVEWKYIKWPILMDAGINDNIPLIGTCLSMSTIPFESNFPTFFMHCEFYTVHYFFPCGMKLILHLPRLRMLRLYYTTWWSVWSKLMKPEKENNIGKHCKYCSRREPKNR